MFTDLKRKEFSVWVNGAEWKDKFSIGAKSPLFIKAIPKEEKKYFNLICVIRDDTLNIQSLALKLVTITFQ
jgi:hypothetical protein